MIHIPVLTSEIIALFQPKPGDCLIDATIGRGGHAAAYLKASPDVQVIGLDSDPEALTAAAENLAGYRTQISLINQNFAYLKDSLIGGGILNMSSRRPPSYTHILFDLGIGSHQLADPVRGFSFQQDAPLDMRYGATAQLPLSMFPPLNFLTERLGRLPTAADLILGLSPADLVQVLRTFGEERYAGRIAAAIKRRLPQSTIGLSRCIIDAVPASYRHSRLHPATRTFQALRLAVNRELESLTAALPQALDLLAPSGVLAVISFHSLEDRIVKQFMKKSAKLSTSQLLTKKPIVPTPAEIAKNPRSRSAKLRALRKT